MKKESSVSYDNLWVILRRKQMTKKELMEKTHISPTTIALLNHNKVVSMNTIITICKVLGCDIGDVVHLTNEGQEANQAIVEYVAELNKPELVREAVVEYMAKNNMSKHAFVKKSGVSSNTLVKVLNGEEIGFKTYRKLMKVLENEVLKNVDDYLDSKK